MGDFFMCNSAALHSNLSKTAFKVYSYLSVCANNKTRACFISKRTIAAACEISLSSVVRATKELRSVGLLEIKARYRENGRQTSNRYILLDIVQATIPSVSKPKAIDDVSRSVSTLSIKTPLSRSQGKIVLFKCSTSIVQAKLSGIEVKVYSYLTMLAGKIKTCFPSKREIAVDCRISISSVFRAIKKLCKLGLLKVQSQTREAIFGNKGIGRNLYILSENICNFKIKLSPLHKLNFLILFSLKMTPFHRSRMTPQGTISTRKVTLKQRKEDLSFKLTKSLLLYKHKFHAWKEIRLAKADDG